MNTTRMAILGVAAVAGVGCVGVLLHAMAGAKPAPVVVVAPPPPPAMVRVLVSRRLMNTGDRVQAADLAWQSWPADGLNPAYITDTSPVTPVRGQLAGAAGKLADAAKSALSNPADGAGASFVGAVVRERILPNEPILPSKVVRSGSAGVMAVSLDPGMRAVALPLTAENAAGGFIQPGDHVDVLMTRSTGDANQNLSATSNPTHGFVTTTVMKNVKVMAIDQNMGAQKTSATVGATATVEATPKQAEYLVLAKASGSITLMLRSYADSAGGAQVGAVDRQAAGQMVVRVFRNSTPSLAPVNQ